jgi:hypothetical protein
MTLHSRSARPEVTIQADAERTFGPDGLGCFAIENEGRDQSPTLTLADRQFFIAS